MSKRFFSLLLLFMLIFSPLSKAETVVLVHGYLSDSQAWLKNKITLPLLQDGWIYGGNYILTPSGFSTPSTQNLTKKGKVFFTVDLPADAPIEFQAGLLGQYLQNLYSARNEAVVLVGHSAGGEVARAWLTKETPVLSKALITIASPHLGTPLAEIGNLTTKTPLTNAIRIPGLKNIRESEAVFDNLKKETPGNYLYWLNHLKHPDIDYISVIRRQEIGLKEFDYVVPKNSQNMNFVWALRNRSAILLTEGDHFLSAKDGVYLRDLFRRIYHK